jgi:hypothetical protein
MSSLTADLNKVSKYTGLTQSYPETLKFQFHQIMLKTQLHRNITAKRALSL